MRKENSVKELEAVIAFLGIVNNRSTPKLLALKSTHSTLSGG